MELSRDELRNKLTEEAHAQQHEGELPNATHRAKARNPLCGDELELQLRIDAGKILEAKTRVRGCLITQASSHALARAVQGLSVSEARGFASGYLEQMNARAPLENFQLHSMSDFTLFKRPHPRQKCALICAEALFRILEACDEN